MARRNKLITEQQAPVQAEQQAEQQAPVQAEQQAPVQAEQQAPVQAEQQAPVQVQSFDKLYIKASKLSLEKALTLSIVTNEWTAALLSVNMDKALSDFFSSKSLGKINYILSVLGKLGKTAPMTAAAFAREFIARAVHNGITVENEKTALHRPLDIMLEYKDGSVVFSAEWGKKHPFGLDFKDEDEKWKYFFEIARYTQTEKLHGTRVGYLHLTKEKKTAYAEINKCLESLVSKGRKLAKDGKLETKDKQMIQSIMEMAISCGYLTGL